MVEKHMHATICAVFRNARGHEIGKSAAALTYYLLFAMFPMLIFISNLLGMLDLDITAISGTLMPIMPDEVVHMLEAYLNHAREESGPVLLWFSLAFSVWFPFRAVRRLTNDVRLAYGFGKPGKPVRYVIRQMIFTLAFLVIIALTLILSVFGSRFLYSVFTWLGLRKVLELPVLMNLWQYLRFFLLGGLMFLILTMLYILAQEEKATVRSLLPGIILSLIAWLMISIVFSIYTENFGRYSVIYGTLGTVIVLLLWLYMTSYILILGAEINGALMPSRN